MIGLVRDLDAVQARLTSDNITNVKLFYADMSDHQSLTKAASGVAEVTDGSLDHLIINAAYQPFDSWHYYLTEYVDKEELLKTEVFRSTDVNILGTIYAVNAFLPLIRNSDVKKVVSISSGHADMDLILDGGVAVSSVYSAIKAAGNVIMAKYAAELKSEGVKFLSLSPGYVLTGQPERKSHIYLRTRYSLTFRSYCRASSKGNGNGRTICKSISGVEGTYSPS